MCTLINAAGRLESCDIGTSKMEFEQIASYGQRLKYSADGQERFEMQSSGQAAKLTVKIQSEL